MLLRTSRHVLGPDLSGLLLSGVSTYQATVLGIAASNLLAYWPLTETSGTTANDVSGNLRHGTYSGVTLAQIAGPGASMGSAGLWDGVNDIVNVLSASLTAAFNGSEGSIGIWVKLNATAWNDANGLDRMVTLQADANNRIMIDQGATNAQLNWYYIAGGTTKNVVDSTHNGNTDWNFYGLTWSIAANQAKAYFGTSQIGSTQTTLGTFAGALSNASLGTTLDGYAAHASLWSAALTPAQMLTLATAR